MRCGSVWEGLAKGSFIGGGVALGLGFEISKDSYQIPGILFLSLPLGCGLRCEVSAISATIMNTQPL